MGWFKREWSSILTIGCIIVAAIIEAWQQALAGSPRVAEVLPSLNGSWHYVPLGLLIIAGVSWFIGHSRKPPQGQQLAASALQTGSLLPTTPVVDFNAADFFRLSHQSQWTADVENRIRIAANQNQPTDREGFYAKLIGIGLVAYHHEITWAYIFKSQILMLAELNRKAGIMPLTEARAFYDNAKITYPQVYSNYSFNEWLAFIKSQQLLIHHPSDMLEITVRGKDFLKYLTHWGRSADERRG